jgi:hypothetical protein
MSQCFRSCRRELLAHRPHVVGRTDDAPASLRAGRGDLPRDARKRSTDDERLHRAALLLRDVLVRVVVRERAAVGVPPLLRNLFALEGHFFKDRPAMASRPDRRVLTSLARGAHLSRKAGKRLAQGNADRQHGRAHGQACRCRRGSVDVAGCVLRNVDLTRSIERAKRRCRDPIALHDGRQGTRSVDDRIGDARRLERRDRVLRRNDDAMTLTFTVTFRCGAMIGIHAGSPTGSLEGKKSAAQATTRERTSLSGISRVPPSSF